MTRLLLLAAAYWLASAALVHAQLPLHDKADLGDETDTRDDRRALSLPTLEALSARYEREPPVGAVVSAALEAERHHPQRFADMASRARLRGLIPHLDVGARRGQGVDLRWTNEIDSNRTTADDVMLFATLRFDLDRLLFAGEEVSITREARFERQAQHELVRQVVHLYFLRRRLQLERDLHGEQTLAQQLRLAEAEALLEAFTDGAFGRMLKGSATSWKTAASTNASKRP